MVSENARRLREEKRLTLDEAARLGEDVARQLLARGAAEVTDLGATKAPRQPS